MQILKRKVMYTGDTKSGADSSTDTKAKEIKK